MGFFIEDGTTLDVLTQLNTRFGPGEALTEMVGLQREFQLFALNHSLRKTFSALHIVPADSSERARWFKFLERLRGYKSDVDKMNGHDRIISAIKDGLEAKTPVPIFFGYHPAHQDPRVTVTRSQPLTFSRETYILISIPTRPPKAKGGYKPPKSKG
jgi:hypothetical protein